VFSFGTHHHHATYKDDRRAVGKKSGSSGEAGRSNLCNQKVPEKRKSNHHGREVEQPGEQPRQICFHHAETIRDLKSDIGETDKFIRTTTRDKSASREKVWRVEPPKPERPPKDMLNHLKGIPAKTWTAWHQRDNAQAFSAALKEQGISLACVTKEEAERSRREAAFARELGRYAPRYREEEIVAIAEPGLAYRDDKIAEP
jgi:hypothetical protein